MNRVKKYTLISFIGFFWTLFPPLQTAPKPPLGQAGWSRHNVSGFTLSRGDSSLVLPVGSFLLLPVYRPLRPSDIPLDDSLKVTGR